MAMQAPYLISVKNLGSFLNALRHAQAPEKLSLRFIEDLGYKSTNDRMFISLLKAMRFVDDGGKPTARYHAFLDDTNSARVLGNGVRDAFSDLFRVNRSAEQLSREQLQGKLKSLSEGKISAAVLTNTTKTFMELVKLADFAPAASTNLEAATPEAKPAPAEDKPGASPTLQAVGADASASHALVYRIEIVLPAVRDQAVYDSIFRSVKEHLLR